MAIATSISPVDLLDTPPEVFWAMVAVLEERQKEMEKQQQGRRK
jgi:hypothetical protein